MFNDFLYSYKEAGDIIIKNIEPNDLINITLPQYISKIKNIVDQPQNLEHFKQIITNLNETISKFFSFEYLLNILSLPLDDSFVDEIKNKFLEEFKEAVITDSDKTKRLFQDLLKVIKDQPKPRELFKFSSYERIGFSLSELEQLPLLELFNKFIMKESDLLKLDKDETKDIIGDLLRRLRESIETYLKVILASILNLSLISSKSKIISFHERFIYYINALDLKGRYNGDYLDLRHAIAHNSYRIYINNQIKISMIFTRQKKGLKLSSVKLNYTLQDLRKRFKIFNSFVFLFIEFIKAFFAS